MKFKIQTRRTTIRDFKLNDIDTFMEYRNDLEWMRYQGFKGMTRESYERELLGNHSLDAGKQYAITDTVTGQLIGDVYLKREQEIYGSPALSAAGLWKRSCDWGNRLGEGTRWYLYKGCCPARKYCFDKAAGVFEFFLSY